MIPSINAFNIVGSISKNGPTICVNACTRPINNVTPACIITGNIDGIVFIKVVNTCINAGTKALIIVGNC